MEALRSFYVSGTTSSYESGTSLLDLFTQAVPPS